MKNQFLICAILLIAALSTVTAQTADTAFASRYEKETIFLTGSSMNKYCKQEKKHRVGIFGRRIKKEFDGVTPEANAEFQGYQKRNKRGVGLLIVGGTVMVAGLILMPVAVVPAAVILGLEGPGLATYCVGAFELGRSRHGLQKAIWLRNRDKIAKN